MGLINAMRGGYFAPGGRPAGPAAAPQMPQGGGLMGAFSGSPDFQNQLGAIMAGQGPGRQPPQFTPPQMPMGMGAAPNQGGQMFQGQRPGEALGFPWLRQQF